MDTKLRLGIVGAGAIAKAYGQAIQASSTAMLAGVADVRLEAARALATTAGCPAYPSHKDLAVGGVDAVVVCTPPATHVPVVIDLVSRGIPVLCEKPLAINPAGALQMLEAAGKNNVLMTMASKFRYVEDVSRAKALVDSGILGEVILFENAFTSRVDMSGRWNSDPVISGGGVLIDNGTHSVDLMRYFLGPLAEVQVVEGKRPQGLAVEDTVRVFVRSRAGVIGTVDLSWSIHKELDSFIDVYGTKGMVRVGWKESKYRQSNSNDWIVFGSGYDKVQAFRAQIDNFCKAVRGEEPLRITSEDALASVRVIEAAYQSMSSNNWVPVKEEDRWEPESIPRPLLKTVS